MSIEPTLVGAIIGGILLLIFIFAGVVLYLGKKRQKRRDRTSLPGGESESFNPTNTTPSGGSYDNDMERYLD